MKTQIELLRGIGPIFGLMRDAQKRGIDTTTFTLKDIPLIEFFKFYESIRRMENVKHQYFGLNELRNPEHHELCLYAIDGHYLVIRSEKVKVLQPKINLINYN